MFLTPDQLYGMGFKHIGKNVAISDKAVFYGIENISIGDNSRIDDFAILSAGPAGIEIGRYVHIGCYSCILGKGPVKMGDYSGLSVRVSVFSSSDPYDGSFMTNPCVPDNVRSTVHAPVTLGKHTVIGAGTVILPGTSLPDGCAVGALACVKGLFLKNTILVGTPAKEVNTRRLGIYELEKLIP
jgi:dTDP-4-amino-4,6-dideoxy-D-glucose acyltransferase